MRPSLTITSCIISCLALAHLACAPEEEHLRPPGLTNTHNETCARGLTNDVFVPIGFVRGGQYWTCRLPEALNRSLEFTGHAGSTAAVTGGTMNIKLEWGGADSLNGHPIVVALKEDRNGYWFVTDYNEENPIEAEFYIDRDARGGDYTLQFAFDDGTGSPQTPHIGPIYEVPIHIYEVGSGDPQVSLSWDSDTDLDLHVIEPQADGQSGGEEIFFGHRNSASGGELDLDSNPACNLDQINNENVYWPLGSAPDGEYIIKIDLWSPCDSFNNNIDTNWRLTVLTAQGNFQTREGILNVNSTETHNIDVLHIVR